MNLRVYYREHGVASRATSRAKMTGADLEASTTRGGGPNVKDRMGRGPRIVTVLCSDLGRSSRSISGECCQGPGKGRCSLSARTRARHQQDWAWG